MAGCFSVLLQDAVMTLNDAGVMMKIGVMNNMNNSAELVPKPTNCVYIDITVDKTPFFFLKMLP